ncbi:hypothetical protein [Streptomyces sp. NPDC049881]|uniref:hypothetical protein n=1 Tax=Streptomyces sp. NPDC049881 TaxID=3155778 RepID=UPI003444B0ED
MVSDTVLVGLLTFLGTALATAAGLWQWRRAQARDARADFRARRVTALTEVWEALSALEEEQRTTLTGPDSGGAAGSDRLTRVNLLLLRRSPFLLADEQEWALAFARHVAEIDTLIRAELAAGRPGEEWWASTRAQPAASHVAATAAERLARLRVTLGGRYAAVVRGEID